MVPLLVIYWKKIEFEPTFLLPIARLLKFLVTTTLIALRLMGIKQMIGLPINLALTTTLDSECH